MAAHNSRLPVPTLPESTYRQVPSPSWPATKAGLVRPGHQIAVLVVIIVGVVFQLAGQAGDAFAGGVNRLKRNRSGHWGLRVPVPNDQPLAYP
ncbi:hypothetical protein ABZV14_04165 [Streptosporangium canum]|uniref:hypothetical protein n=1 Tax=Streptosporangium canum TaxID=324952 RepID=UPI0033AB924E